MNKRYNEAKKAFDTSDFETAKLKSEGVTNLTEGSESLVIKANEILDKVTNSETTIVNSQKNMMRLLV